MPNGGTRIYGGRPWRGAWDRVQRRYVVLVNGEKTRRVARMICEAFHGAAPVGADTVHLDEDSRNNAADNLRWGSRKENLNFPAFLAYCADVCILKMSGARPREMGILPTPMLN